MLHSLPHSQCCISYLISVFHSICGTSCLIQYVHMTHTIPHTSCCISCPMLHLMRHVAPHVPCCTSCPMLHLMRHVVLVCGMLLPLPATICWRQWQGIFPSVLGLCWGDIYEQHASIAAKAINNNTNSASNVK